MDHPKRRREIAQVALGVVAREGLEAATIRRIAQELGCSTKVVTHYFPSKKDLLLSAFAALADEGHARADAAFARDPASIVDVLMTMVASDEDGMRRWRIYLAFWEWAAREPDALAEQRRHMAHAIGRTTAMLEGQGVPAGRAGFLADLLNAFVQGISVQAVLDPERWPVARVREAIVQQAAYLLDEPAEAAARVPA